MGSKFRDQTLENMIGKKQRLVMPQTPPEVAAGWPLEGRRGGRRYARMVGGSGVGVTRRIELRPQAGKTSVDFQEIGVHDQTLAA